MRGRGDAVRRLPEMVQKYRIPPCSFKYLAGGLPSLSFDELHSSPMSDQGDSELFGA